MNENFYPTETVEQAENYKLGRRANLPAVYKPERTNEQPIPHCDFISNSSDLSTHQFSEMSSDVINTESDTTESTISLAGLFDGVSDCENSVSVAEHLVPMASLDIHFVEENDLLAEDVKPIIECKINEEDAEAIENIFAIEHVFGIDDLPAMNDVDESYQDLAVEEYGSNNEEVEAAAGDGSEKPNENVDWEPIGGGDEIYIAHCQEMPKPSIDHVDLSVKCNDIVSGKMLFAAAVS